MTSYRSAILCLALAAGPALAENLYQEGHFRALMADQKAVRVGDVITVQVYENSSANTSVDTGTHRRNAISAGLDHGASRIVGQTGVAVSGEFDGGGTTQRTSRLLTTLTVTVREVLPSGDLRIGGEQILTVNDEVQKVNLEGRVRPQDVSDSNVVLSTRLADAHITYVGEGDMSERSKRGWWRRLLDAFGL